MTLEPCLKFICGSKYVCLKFRCGLKYVSFLYVPFKALILKAMVTGVGSLSWKWKERISGECNSYSCSFFLAPVKWASDIFLQMIYRLRYCWKFWRHNFFKKKSFLKIWQTNSILDTHEVIWKRKENKCFF